MLMQNHKPSMSDQLSIRLVICTEFGPVGSRLERGEPLPSYQPDYPNTPEGLFHAEEDMGKIAIYLNRHKAHQIKYLKKK
jgi:hypothetical protein